MPADLTPVAAALAELDEGELAALIEATNNVPQTAPTMVNQSRVELVAPE